MRTVPEVCSSVVVRMEIVVVLPAPFGPSRQQNSPLATWKLMSFTALRGAPRYRLTRCATSIAVIGGISPRPGGQRPGSGVSCLALPKPPVPGVTAAASCPTSKEAHHQPDRGTRQEWRAHLALEVSHEQGEVERTRQRATGGMLVARHCRRRLQQVLHCQGRPGLHRDPGGDLATVSEMMHGAWRYADPLTGPRSHVAPANPESHRALEHRERFLLLGMGVAARYPAAGREPELPVQYTPAGLRSGAHDQDLLAAERVHDDIRLDHPGLLASRLPCRQ